VVKRGARADLFSPVRPLEASERVVLESEVDAFYRTFVGVVARGRGRAFEDIERLAQGRIYSGVLARSHGLVDELGGLSDAVARASELAGIGPLLPRLVTPPRGEGPPPAAARVAQAALSAADALGLSPVAERALLGLHLGPRERVLVYEPWGSERRTWLDVE